MNYLDRVREINRKMGQNRALQQTCFIFLITSLLIFGVYFRFLNIDKKIYWIDETYTSLRISGHTEAEAIKKLYNGEVISVASLQKYQQPNSEKGLAGTLNSLAIESPQHPPLYYIMARYWVQQFGDSVATPRTLSALISLLVFPALYWLCLELFESPLVAWIAIALMAVSPFHVLYAQEAREYSLWTVTTLLSSAALLRAIRLQTKLYWGIYAATIALNLYTFLFAWFVTIAQGIYFLRIEDFRWNKTVKIYLIALSAGILAFSPWLWVTVANLNRLQTSAAWTNQRVAFGFLLQRLLVHTSNVFFDLNIGYKSLNPPSIAILFIIAYSIYFLCRHTPPKVWLFILTLMGVPALALILPDLILGGLRSTTARYLIPYYLGIQLAVAYLLATQLPVSRHPRQQKFWHLILIALALSGILSCTISSQAQFWWNKSPSKNQYLPQIAQIVNQTPNPLLISDNSPILGDCFTCRMLSLSYLLDPKVKLQLVLEPQVPKIPAGFSDIFVFSPSQTLIKGIEIQQNRQTELLLNNQNFWLWKLKK
jgi:uncharacterized membrane protein